MDDSDESIEVKSVNMTLKKDLPSNSRKVHNMELSHLAKYYSNEDFSSELGVSVVSPMIRTFACYEDRKSRLAVQKCLRAIVRNTTMHLSLASLVINLSVEASKSGLAATNALVLTEWCCVLLQEIRLKKNLWNEHGISIVLTVAKFLRTCLYNTRRGALKRSAFKKVHYTLRLLYSTNNVFHEYFYASVDALMNRNSANVSHIIMLGIISRLASAVPHLKDLLLSRKGDIINFYICSIVESRVTLPRVITGSLDTFFQNFCTYNDLELIIMPAVEKALLRAPEVVLNGQIKPLFEAQRLEMDMSNLLKKSLMKPLLAHIGSSDKRLRNGAADLFKCIIVRSHNDTILESVAGDILGMLQKPQSSIPEQKALLAQILSSCSFSPAVSYDISFRLFQIVKKEFNEQAAMALIECIAGHFRKRLSAGFDPDELFSAQFCQALDTRNLVLQRLWTIHIAEILWEIPLKLLENSEYLQFITKLFKSFERIVADNKSRSTVASYADQVLAVNVLTALVSSKFRSNKIGKFAEHITDVLQVSSQFDLGSCQLLNIRLNAKLSDENDIRWAVRAISALSDKVIESDEFSMTRIMWSQIYIYFFTSADISRKFREEIKNELLNLYVEKPIEISSLILHGIWAVIRDVSYNDTTITIAHYRAGMIFLPQLIRTIFPAKGRSEQRVTAEDSLLRLRLADLVILCQPSLIPHISWIDVCLDGGQDPGILVAEVSTTCMAKIKSVTETDQNFSNISVAACKACADLVFVAPQVFADLVLEQIKIDLDTAQLERVGDDEAAIYMTPEGELYSNITADTKQTLFLDKTAKDYDTLKWEMEIREQIAQKKRTDVLSKDSKNPNVQAQLAKEAKIRQDIAKIAKTLRRGLSVSWHLISGPPTDVKLWIGPVLEMLLGLLRKNAGKILGDLVEIIYIESSKFLSNRLGTLKNFIAIATIRAINGTNISNDLKQEPLLHLCTRILYRLKFLSEKRPFDTISFHYTIPLIVKTLENGGLGESISLEEANEQITLALEYLSSHAELCTDIYVPRKEILTVLIHCLKTYPKHYKLTKDILANVFRHISSSCTASEISLILKKMLLPEPAVRLVLLEAVDAEIDLSASPFSQEIWILCHDEVIENKQIAQTIWHDSDMRFDKTIAAHLIQYIESPEAWLRNAAAKALTNVIRAHRDIFGEVLLTLQNLYRANIKERNSHENGPAHLRRNKLEDQFELREGIATAFKELARIFQPAYLLSFLNFLLHDGALNDNNPIVRQKMLAAAVEIVNLRGNAKLEELMDKFEETLEVSNRSESSFDTFDEAVVVLYGALGCHLPIHDNRVPKLIFKLLSTLDTPSETVQFAVAQTLPRLITLSSDESSAFIDHLMNKLLKSATYAVQRGAAYGLAGIIYGRGVISMHEFGIMRSLTCAVDNKKDHRQRQAAFIAYELFSLILSRLFEPYAIEIMPHLLIGFGDAKTDVREACLDASKTIFSRLSSYGVKRVLPMLLQGLEDSQWRSKKGACDSLGAMAYLDPQQLAQSLPEIIPPLTSVLNDSHKDVRSSARSNLQRFGDIISNPEIHSIAGTLLKALSNPAKHTEEALDSLLKISFIHYLDAPSLALLVPILERGLGDRSGLKRKAAQIIGSLSHLAERKDLVNHLDSLIHGLRTAAVDPVPTTRATASKALGSLMEKLGEDVIPDLIPSLMAVLRSDTGAGDRLGSAQALSEILAGLGTSRLNATLPSILQNIASSKAVVREGFMSLFIFLPACFGNSFSVYLTQIVPSVLAGLADDVETVRETSLKAGRLLVKNYSNRAVDLLLPALEQGLADDKYRIRLSSVELVGDLLFTLSGVSTVPDFDEDNSKVGEAIHSLSEVLGPEKRNRILSALYICRCDTAGQVRVAAVQIWKTLVTSPRILKGLIPTLSQLIVSRLGGVNMEQKHIASNALGELIRKAGEGVVASLLPTLESELKETFNPDIHMGICIALREISISASTEILEDYENTLMSSVRLALLNRNEDVRLAAAETFDALQNTFGKRMVDQVIRYLLKLLDDPREAGNALLALLTLLNNGTRSHNILPNLLPTLLSSSMSTFNARAIASLAKVASPVLTRRLPQIINGLMDNIIASNDPEKSYELNNSLDVVLLSVDEFDGLNAAINVMLALVKDQDHCKRISANMHMANFITKAEIDFSRYYQDLIRVFLLAYDDSDLEVVKSAFLALTELVKRLRKEEMESLVLPTRQILLQVGYPGCDLSGFLLPKGIGSILPLFVQGLINGNSEQKVQAALGISDIIDRTSSKSIQPFVAQITGPLIRVVTERVTEVRAAILFTLNKLLLKIPAYLKPFVPQLQRTFTKSLTDTSSDILRSRAAIALGSLIKLNPKLDPLIAELVNGSKTADTGVKVATLKALFEVLRKSKSSISDSSMNMLISLINVNNTEDDEIILAVNAKLLSALLKVLPDNHTDDIIRDRILVRPITKLSILSLNSALVECPEILLLNIHETLVSILCDGILDTHPFVSENSVIAAGKYLLTDSSRKDYEITKQIFSSLSEVVTSGNALDTRRLALVVLRTISRRQDTLVRPHLSNLAPAVFANVRESVIPIKMAAEAAFLSIFSVVSEDAIIFNKYIEGSGSSLPPQLKKSMQDYFKRVTMRLAGQAKDRLAAEGGINGLGLSNDEVEDEKELWSVGRVEIDDVMSVK